jgi:lysozyme family protein
MQAEREEVMSRFQEIMETVFKWEGGFVNNPFDNGGPTNMGITHTALAQWRGVAGVTVADVRNLTKQEATDIFRSRYWGPIKGESLPAPLDLIVMDGAVNHGVENMSRMLQKAVGAEQDGEIGDITIAAVRAATTTEQALLDLAIEVAELRKSRYVNHEDALHFLPGWRNRLNDVMFVALKPYPVSWTFKDGRKTRDGAVPGDGTATGPTPVTSITRAVIDDADLQAALATFGVYKGDIDGLFGPQSIAAMNKFLASKAALISGDWQTWPLSRAKLALGQLICRDLDIDVGRIDGLFGPQTKFAFEEFDRKKMGLPKDAWRDELDALPPSGTVPTGTTWPKESDVPTFFGPLGNDCELVPLKRLTLPYKMKLAWELGTEITGFRVHEKVHDSAARVFDKIFAHYGDSGIDELGLNLFGGCTGCRKKRGGTSWSMHAWSIAIDFDPERNQLSWNHTRARLAKPDAVRLWELWEAEGWVSLGRAKDFDWMHVQAARV